MTDLAILLLLVIVLCSFAYLGLNLALRNPERDARLKMAERQRAELAATMRELYSRALAGRDADPELEYSAVLIEKLIGTGTIAGQHLNELEGKS
jgi:hypothetical protein